MTRCVLLLRGSGCVDAIIAHVEKQRRAGRAPPICCRHCWHCRRHRRRCLLPPSLPLLPPSCPWQLTEGLGVEVRQDAGDGKGKGIFTTQVRRQVLFLQAEGLWPWRGAHPPAMPVYSAIQRLLYNA